jgi:hypothetical protein
MSVPVIDANVSTEVAMPARSAVQSDPRIYSRWAGVLALVLVVLSTFSMMCVQSTL